MTVHDVMQWLEQFQAEIGVGLVVLPLLTYILGALMRPCSRPLARYVLAGAIYLAVLPGVSSAVMLLYLLLFVRADVLREAHLILHVLPIGSMLATLWAASRLEKFDDLPGFDRMQGLMLLVGLSFAVLLFIHKMFIGLVFFARFEYLLLLLGAFLVFWRLGVARLFRKPQSTR